MSEQKRRKEPENVDGRKVVHTSDIVNTVNACLNLLVESLSERDKRIETLEADIQELRAIVNQYR